LKAAIVEVVHLIFPVFAVIVTGYVFARFGVLPETVSAALVQFVYYVAIPALLFVIIAQQEIDSLLDWPFIIAFGGAVSAVSLLIFLGVLYWRGADVGSAIIVAMICVQCNNVTLGSSACLCCIRC
jgi:malonate transporter and related proteins